MAQSDIVAHLACTCYMMLCRHLSTRHVIHLDSMCHAPTVLPMIANVFYLQHAFRQVLAT